MSSRAKKQNTSRRNRRILISVAAVSLVLIIILAYVYSTHPGTNDTTKKASSVYFAISGLGGIYEVRSQTNNTTPGLMVLLKEFTFNFTPVGGDARDLRIFASGLFDTANADWEGKTITRGTSTYTDIQLPNPIPITYDNSSGTYPMGVRFESQEATGLVTLNFTADSLFSIIAPV